MKLHKYKDYDDYVAKQVAANELKIESQWVIPENIEFLCYYIRTHWIDGGKLYGTCHGTRRGLEQSLFIEYLKYQQRDSSWMYPSVIGTEISPTANEFPNTIQHDFHEPYNDFKRLNFVYSNSLDHAYHPRKAVRTWMESLCKHGLCIIEWSDKHEKNSTKTDPFACPIAELVYNLILWTSDLGFIKEILDAPKVHDNGEIKWIKFIILQKY